MFRILRLHSLACCCAVGIFTLAVAMGRAQGSQTPSTAASAAAPKLPELRVFDPSLVDASVDPCDNFYQFSCKRWLQRNPLPADQTSYSRFTELEELNRLHLKHILEEISANSGTRTSNEQKIGDEYASCMDVAAITRPHRLAQEQD